MMRFVIYVKQQIKNDVIERFLATCFSLKEREIAPLMAEETNIVIRYYFTKSENLTEFNYRITMYISESLCFQNKIYNELQLAIPFAALINDDVVIDDKSLDPTRWILVNRFGKIFVADELFVEDDDYSFVIDRSTMKKVTSEEAFAVLPSKDYVEIEPESRPPFINKSESWNKLLERP